MSQPWLKWRLRREAVNLYTSKVRVPKMLAGDIVTRTQEGLSVQHIRIRMIENRRYVRAYIKALDSMGVLGAIERIMNSERFKQSNG